MGKGRTVGLALFLVSLSFVFVPACGTPIEIAEGELCAPDTCPGGDCATPGPRVLRDGPRRRCWKPKKADAGAAAGAKPADTGTMPEDDAVFPCAICARADNCCRAQGNGGCAYTSTCTSARTTDETDFLSAVCRAVVESGQSPLGAGCTGR